eukprot:sb/3469586/
MTSFDWLFTYFGRFLVWSTAWSFIAIHSGSKLHKNTVNTRSHTIYIRSRIVIHLNSSWKPLLSPHVKLSHLGGGLPQESHASLAIFRVAEIFEIFDFWLKNVGFLRFLRQICQKLCQFTTKISKISNVIEQFFPKISKISSTEKRVAEIFAAGPPPHLQLMLFQCGKKDRIKQGESLTCKQSSSSESDLGGWLCSLFRFTVVNELELLTRNRSKQVNNRNQSELVI